MAATDAFDRDMDTQRLAFGKARRALGALLSPLTSARDVEDLVISRAEEYGVTHTLEALALTPGDFRLDKAPSPNEMPAITRHLTAAYEANAAMDRLVDARERALAGGDYAERPFTLQLFGRVMSYDPERETARYADTGETRTPTLVTVKPRPKLKTPDKTRER